FPARHYRFLTIAKRRASGAMLYGDSRYRGVVMSGNAAFTGDIPQHYDEGLGPMLFVDYADDIARRTAAYAPKRVLEIAAGTEIVTRRLYDLLPKAEILATDLNEPMLKWAAKKFSMFDTRVSFRPADAMALSFADNMCDAIVCQFGVMF